MESGRKRKATATPTSTEGTAKKLKLLNTRDTPSTSTSANNGQSQVQQIGQKLMAHLRQSKDKNGRLISTQFLTLPPADELPDYYAFTKMPLALDTIDDRVEANSYATLTELESDLKRMVQNAKDYNAPKSDIFEDAERIRKAVYNYMKLHNPAYNDPEYASFATPIPQRLLDAGAGTVNGVNGHGHHPPRTIKLKGPAPAASASPAPERGSRRSVTTPGVSEGPDRKSSVAPSTATGDGGDESSDFVGKTFQQAQHQLMTEMINYKDGGIEIFQPFANLPSRKLEDYYQTIKYPVCLKKVQKRTRGQHGRDAPTNVTDFKTWDAFEEEVSFIWRNALQYNEDGSELAELAEEFKGIFLDRLAVAKEQVDEPAGPKLKLTTKPKVTLNLSQHRNSPTPAANQATPGASASRVFTVDNEALARQKQTVRAGLDGRQTPAITPRPPTAQTPAATANGIRSSSNPAGSPPVSLVKNERTTTQSPALAAAAPALGQPNGTTSAMMPPPAVRQPSDSPFPHPQTHHPHPAAQQTYHPPAAPLVPSANLRPYPASAATMPLLTLSTHPHLPLPKPWSLALPPHPSLSLQSHTLVLPPSHYYLQIAPTVSRDLSMGLRAYKVFASVNGVRLQARDTVLEGDGSGRRRHVFEGVLQGEGVNRLEVEVVATGREGAEGVEVEKAVVFVRLGKV